MEISGYVTGVNANSDPAKNWISLDTHSSWLRVSEAGVPVIVTVAAQAFAANLPVTALFDADHPGFGQGSLDKLQHTVSGGLVTGIQIKK